MKNRRNNTIKIKAIKLLPSAVVLALIMLTSGCATTSKCNHRVDTCGKLTPINATSFKD